jgi:hypothetical protein
MAFKLQQTATYVWPVKIVLPVDGGKREVHTFDATFRRLPQSRINEIIKLARLQERGRLEDDQELEDQDAAREIMTGWTGVHDDDNVEIPFSEGALAQLLEIPTVAGQIVKAWFGSLAEAKRKNS